MQEKDVIAKEYLQDPGRFADLLNAEWFQGNPVLGPENIREKKGRSARIHRKAGRIRTAETTGDVAKEVVLKGKIIWVMLEAQSDIHFAMPVRIANEESMRYQEQWRNLRNQHRSRKDLKGTEYISGFGKSDRLIPVITLILHLGSKPWEGARSLKELMDLTGWPRRACEMIEDQRIHLIDVRRYPHPEVFRTDLCCVFGFLKNSGQKEAVEEIRKYPQGSLLPAEGGCLRFHRRDGGGSGTDTDKREEQNRERSV
ncbi:MAG TPA: Rpn family recombination-promoting nuclease/putative transposase [Candidatus Pullilachnospira stercoravium]|uniref:Rpn family recombination-promoting nuclease/putative transposase n=1 Tax=Candidatus Pullilachnospira stercoravium TaxID=2840913 RepID=A0A9D1NVG1_9FIRM|nr:Rpn family recombination-promoting nuclease/putative transposase [Candidatus Pullilachnospira stercoravium]